jgi:hypothetical protein
MYFSCSLTFIEVLVRDPDTDDLSKLNTLLVAER